MTDNLNYSSSLLDFHGARRRAGLRQILARLTGRSADLLSYDDVREKLHARGGSSKGLQEIPLDAIVGSVGRYTDFTRGFLPKNTVDRHRWAGVGSAVTGNIGLPPIDVYKLGEAYFVLDGNHRVSIAREMGVDYIEAYVTEVFTRVALSPGDSPDDIILKARYAEFLEKTKLDQLHDGVSLNTTAPGQYRKLHQHIEAHRYFMGIDFDREIEYSEAVSHWYTEVYLPVIERIRQQDILREFPGRTETDLYIWVMEHRDALAKALGWHVEPKQAVADLVAKAGESPGRVLTRVRNAVAHTVGADMVAPVTGDGPWRREEFGVDLRSRFARDILVPVNGESDGWYGLELAIQFAQRDRGRIHGLYVDGYNKRQPSAHAESVKTEFEARCMAAAVPSELTIDFGSIVQCISDRARWVDLVIPQLFHPPGRGPMERMSSGFRSLVLGSPVPVLAVPGQSNHIQRILLAYDGSQKARESLYIGGYFANRWEVEIIVATVTDNVTNAQTVLEDARTYLATVDVVPTSIHSQSNDVGDGILGVAAEHNVDLVVMGGYSHVGIIQAVLGSSVDQVLHDTTLPVLICR